jgi:predicted alpha/beta-fold hydrolase
VNHPYIPFCGTPLYSRSIAKQEYSQGIAQKTAKLFVTTPVNGKSPADELTRKDPQLLVTSAIQGSAEAHSHIAPPKRSLSTRAAWQVVGAQRRGCGNNLYRSRGLRIPTTRGSALRHAAP